MSAATKGECIYFVLVLILKTSATVVINLQRGVKLQMACIIIMYKINTFRYQDS